MRCTTVVHSFGANFENCLCLSRVKSSCLPLSDIRWIRKHVRIKLWTQRKEYKHRLFALSIKNGRGSIVKRNINAKAAVFCKQEIRQQQRRRKHKKKCAPQSCVNRKTLRMKLNCIPSHLPFAFFKGIENDYHSEKWQWNQNDIITVFRWKTDEKKLTLNFQGEKEAGNKSSSSKKEGINRPHFVR